MTFPNAASGSIFRISASLRAVTNERVTKIRELKRKGNAASVTKTDQKALPEEEKEEDINTYLPLNPPLSGLSGVITSSFIQFEAICFHLVTLAALHLTDTEQNSSVRLISINALRQNRTISRISIIVG